MQPNVTTLHLSPKSNLTIGSPVAEFTHSDLAATTTDLPTSYMCLERQVGERVAWGGVVGMDVDLFIHR
jgi:hypothetical protein